MAVSASFRDYVIDQLEQAGGLPIRTNRMFGGVGIYAGDLFFAIIAEEMVYFKVDDSNRADYEDAGMEAFTPFADKEIAVGYYQLPEEVLEDVSDLEPWVAKSVAVAAQAAQGKPPKRKKKAI